MPIYTAQTNPLSNLKLEMLELLPHPLLYHQFKDEVSCRCGVARKVLSIVPGVHGVS